MRDKAGNEKMKRKKKKKRKSNEENGNQKDAHHNKTRQRMEIRISKEGGGE